MTNNRPNPHGFILPTKGNIPPELKMRDNWVVWKVEEKTKGNEIKLFKVPFCALTGAKGVQNKPKHWSNFDTAWNAYERNKTLLGIGFCMGGDEIVAIDLDDCIDINGGYSDLAQEALELFDDSYIELSPSGTGLRIFVLGSIPRDMSKPVEIYQARGKRYVTLTGRRISKGKGVIRVEAFDNWYAKMAGAETQKSTAVNAREANGSRSDLFAEVNLKRLPQHAFCILHGEEWDKYNNDASTVLFGFCKDAFRAGYTRDEVISLCLDSQYAFSEVVERHCNSTERDRQIQWLTKYNVEKAEREVAVELKPEPKSTHNEILDGENYYSRVDLLQHVEDNHPMKKMSRDVSKALHLPENTVLLIGLAVYSSMAARRFKVLYRDGKGLPIGLYVVIEQPSGASKSRCLNIFQEPFRVMHSRIKKEQSAWLKVLEAKEKLSPEETEELALLKEKCKMLNGGLFTTNATPEGLEKTLTFTGGYFAALSSEQGLFNALLGLCSNGTNNNDLVLNGFDGGYVSSARVTREGYSGQTVGSVVCFAQPGSAETVLNVSNGTGLSERFLMLTEPHLLGQRDHTEQLIVDRELEDAYSKTCQFFARVLECPRSLDELDSLHISDNGYLMIAQYRNQIEPHLADGGKFAHISLRGAASKIDMQIMKLAANLHLLEGTEGVLINDRCIQSAIGIADELLEANYRMCQDKGLMGQKAEFTSILALFQDNPKPRSERNIIQSKSQTQPFKSFTGNKSELIRETLGEMVDQNLLTKQCDKDGMVTYSLAQ